MDGPTNGAQGVRTRILGRSSKGFFKLPENQAHSASSLDTTRSAPDPRLDLLSSPATHGRSRAPLGSDKIPSDNLNAREHELTRRKNEGSSPFKNVKPGQIPEIPRRTLSIGKQVEDFGEINSESYEAYDEIKFPTSNDKTRALASKVAAATIKFRDNQRLKSPGTQHHGSASTDLKSGTVDHHSSNNNISAYTSNPSLNSSADIKLRQAFPSRKEGVEIPPRNLTARRYKTSRSQINANSNMPNNLNGLETFLNSKNSSQDDPLQHKSQTIGSSQSKLYIQRQNESKKPTYNTYTAPSDVQKCDIDANEGGFDNLLKELAQLSDQTGTDKSANRHQQPQKPPQAPPKRLEKSSMFTPMLDISVDTLMGKNDAHKTVASTNQSRMSNEGLKPLTITSPSQELSSPDTQSRPNTSLSTITSNLDTGKSETTILEKQAYRRELIETDRKRREADSIKMDRKEADRRELEMIAAARLREQGCELTGNPAIIIASSSKNEEIIVNDYINALCSLLEEDQTSVPLPDDFYSIEGFAAWENTINMSLSSMVSKILKIRFPSGKKFVDRFSPAPVLATRQLPDKDVINELLSKESLTVSLSIFEARNIVVREGKRSAVYCEMQSGKIPEYGTAEAKKYEKSKAPKEIYRTTVSEGSSPKWNQSVTLQTKACDEKIQISVFDKRKDHFHGQLTVSYMDILLTASSGKQLKGWFPLKSIHKKEKDNKYVGGDIYFEAKISSIPKGIIPENTDNKPSVTAHKSLDDTISDLESLDIKPNSLFMILIKTCLELDLRIPGGKKFNQLFSPESRTLLKIMADVFGISIFFIDYAYLKLIYERSSRNEIQIVSVLSSYERLKEDMKHNIKSIKEEERDLIANLLTDIYDHYRAQIVNYKEVYPDNKPHRALETIILLMRMIFKNSLYSDAHASDAPQSFRDELRAMLSEAALNRYQKLKELTDPLDDSNFPSVINGMVKLAELVYSELEADAKIYYNAFIKELDISRLTTEIYLKYFILALERVAEIMPSDEAIKTCSESIFELHHRVQQIDNDYAKKIPGLKRYSINMGFSPERWFTAFLLKWLSFSEEKLIEWAKNAVKEDKFIPINRGGGRSQHSSSIVDLFSAIYTELKFIEDLNWSHPIQNSIFVQSFSQSVYKSIETYCSKIMISNKCSNNNGEDTEKNGAISSWQSFITMTQKRDLPKDTPHEIDKETCVKLCNIEYADTKLKELYSAMNGSTATKIIRDYRDNRDNSLELGSNSKEVADTTGGTFKMSIVMAENLKGVNKNSTSNPYIILSLPYGTKTGSNEESGQSIFSRYFGSIAQRSSDKRDSVDSGVSAKYLSKEINDGGSDSTSNADSIGAKKPTELLKTRAQSDTINPVWDETYSVSIPKFGKLTMQIFSKNFISSDTLIGNATIDLSESSPLHKLALDHETHNVYVEVEPQGRVHLRIVMEGAFEDTDFWFRRARECLEFIRSDIVRFLSLEIFPYIQEVILKSIKQQESAVVSSKSFFSLKATVNYLDVTADGKPVNEHMNPSELSLILDPLFDYLNRNLTTLTDNLTIKLSQEVIRKVWEDIEQCLITCMVPQLYGTIEKDRRVLNFRQLSLVENLLKELCSFFHAGGEEMGLPLRALRNMNYEHLISLFKIYTKDLEFVKKICETEISNGKTNGLTLRCARGKIHMLEGENRNDGRKWFEAQLSARRVVEQSRK